MFEVCLCWDLGRYHVKLSGYRYKASNVSDSVIVLACMHYIFD